MTIRVIKRPTRITNELYLIDPLIRPQFEEKLLLEPQEKGYEVLLIEPYYKSLLRGACDSSLDINASLPILTFLDLYHFLVKLRPSQINGCAFLEKMSIHLEEITDVVFSHKHNDHIAGCKEILEKLPENSRVYLPKGFPRFRKSCRFVDEIVSKVKSLQVENVAPCHCSGQQLIYSFKRYTLIIFILSERVQLLRFEKFTNYIVTLQTLSHILQYRPICLSLK